MDTNKSYQIIRVAKKYYELHMGQLEIAQEEGVSKSTISRMLQKAVDLGYVKVTIDAPIESVKEMADKSDSGIEDKEKMIEYLLRYSTDNAIKMPLNQKKQMLVKDESFEKIRALSDKAFEMTQDVLAKKLTEPNDQELEDMKNTLNKALKEVKDYNKQQAVWLVSEGILDLNFVKNPKTEIMSIRLGKRLHSK